MSHVGSRVEFVVCIDSFVYETIKLFILEVRGIGLVSLRLVR